MNEEILNYKNDNKAYKRHVYFIKYPVFEEELCKLEMRCLFGKTPSEKYLFSDSYINISRSPFIKEMISIIYEEDSLEQILKNIIEDKLSYDDFKVCYVKLENGDVEYKERLNSLNKIGFVITGEPEMHNPKIILGITKICGKWIFGKYEKNDYEWHIHDKKPYSYSNSLGLRVARALVNIAVQNNLDCKLIDPCCGVGTVVIEALSMGINVVGCELNKSIAENAQRNLKFFGYENVVTNGDMNNIEKQYDVSIIDLPYGLFTPTTIEEQTSLIKSARRISKKLVIVTFENMDKEIIEAGFNIVDRSYVCKGKFKRYITICE
ncbi:DNA methylase N-4/N-6 domain protein [Clostridium sp. DL-VIII]|uniref:TRM11 family SAM-dependent methyltransferase n=1 Tax=Clostridium sp. DL-VIII TaxID=641107 RepID=UPI00023AF7EE|nr:RsmD family RNA methyltransferase [Clostridium sp. DL-VIII]EHI96870.1 DNA methylase N-4/N-6 domain protein [Clostridium sp. DL-VIII]